MDWYVALGLVGLLLLPFYLFLVSKWMQVGRMSGARWFAKRFNRE